MAVKVVITNPDAWEEVVARSTVMRDHLRSRAESIAATARSLAPIDTGAYVGSIGTSEGYSQNGRPMARVIAEDKDAAVIEFGSGRSGHTFAVFRRAAQQAGGYYIPSSAADKAAGRG